MVDKLDSRKLMAAAIASWSSATFLSGLATSFLAFALLRAAVSVSEAVFNPLAFSLISDAIPRGRRARAFGLYLSAGALGTVIAYLLGSAALRLLSGAAGAYGAPSVIVPLLSTLAPWRCVILLVAAPGLLLATLVLLKLGVPTQAAAEPAVGALGGEAAIPFLRGHWPLLVYISLGLAFAQLGAFAALTWNVVFFQRVHGWDLSMTAALLGATGGTTALLGCIAGGPFIEAVRRRGFNDAPMRVGLAASMLYAAFATAGFLASSLSLAIAALALASFWGYVPSVAVYSAMSDVLPAGSRGRFAGFNTLVVGVVTNAVGPLAVGTLNDRMYLDAGGIRYSLVVTILASTVASAALLLPGLRLYRRRLAELAFAGRLPTWGLPAEIPT